MLHFLLNLILTKYDVGTSCNLLAANSLYFNKYNLGLTKAFVSESIVFIFFCLLVLICFIGGWSWELY